nr:hypothetical protein [Tanacetum cinerariifolium]
MKRVGTGFSGEVTLLFDNMLVPAPKEVGILQADAQPIPIPTEPSTSKPQKKHKPKRKHIIKPRVPPTESPAEHNVPLHLPSHDLLPSGEDSLKLKELMDLCTNFSNKVIDLESEVLDIKSTYKAKIEKLESRVERLEEENRVLKEFKGVHSIIDSDETVMEKEESSKQGRKIANIDANVEINLEKLEVELNADINWNAAIEQVKRSKRLTDAVMKYQALKRNPLTEAQARRNMIVYLKNMASYKMNYFKGMSYGKIRPLFEKHYNYNQAFLNEVSEGIKVPEQEVRQEKEVEVESSKREDATPLASKILIVDYKIYTKRNTPYFKIIRADRNHRLFMSFSTMMKNFDREDLESLWKIIRPIVEANVWKDQKGKYGLAKVKT